jgi:UPF0755 protein
MKEKIIKWKQKMLDELEIVRIKMITHPKAIVWRLKFFGIHPMLGRHFWRIASSVAVGIFVFILFYGLFWRAPRPFPKQALVSIERGETLSEIANSLEQNGVIMSDFWLKSFVMLWGGQRGIVAGDYYFPKALSVFSVAKKISKGEFGIIAIKITLPEGLSSYEMADILSKQLPAFNPDDFLKEVGDNNYEGYLFPDTYFFTPNTKANDVILTMRENFVRQIKTYEEDMVKSGKTLSDIVIVASIIEDEANNSLDSKRVVSGILWKRLREGMPLQVDAPFIYHNGKNSYTLTKEDLEEDHEYNTYVNKGLPPTAITNPGIDSLRAAIAPTNTDYLYFLSDRNGNLHYAEDFEGHKRNRELYLN